VEEPEDRYAKAVFYSHDTVGLGHLRRTLLICDGLAARFHQRFATLVVTGSPMAHAFRIPSSVDYVKLPSVAKVENEVYRSRSLALPFVEILRLREEIVFQTVANYRPDIFFVDNVPLGMKGEIRKALDYIRTNLRNTATILSLRDILDDGRHIVPLWRRQGIFEAIDRYFDRVCIYGQPLVFNPMEEYEWPESIRRKACFCGYLPRAVDKEASRATRRKHLPEGGKLVFVAVGGGSDGAPIVSNYLQALPSLYQEVTVSSIVLLGPDMDAGVAEKLVAEHETDSRVSFMEYCDDPLPYMDAADVVVSMAGYNTISEILALRKQAVVVPRVHPRQEQLIRSRRLQELGLLRMIHPDELNPSRLAQELLAQLASGAQDPRAKLEFTGLDRLAGEVAALMNQGRAGAVWAAPGA